MGEQKNTVIINGKTYDAVSGILVKDRSPKGQLVSDFVSTPKSRPSPPKARKAHHLAHHKPQKSITLKRSMGHKQSSFANAKSLPINTTDIVTAEAEKVLLSNGNHYHHAKNITKSHAISRFNFSNEAKANKQHLPLAVKPAPQEKVSYHHPAPKAEFSAKGGEDMFSAAISHATSHEQKPLKLSKRKHRVAKKLGISTKFANVTAIVLVTVALSGFIVYQNAASISMHMAANQSGLASASLPGFKPSGFSLSRQFATSPGQVALKYHSNSDERAFTVTQASSNWNSQTLADSFLTGKQAQRFNQPDGKTVFIYGGSNATWVDGGIWYRVEGQSALSTDQLLKFASSF